MTSQSYKIFFILLFFGQSSYSALPKNSGNEGFVEKTLNFFNKAATSVSDFFYASSSYLETSFINKLDLLKKDPSFLFQIILAFLAGLSVSLTPCVYPLIPVTIGILSSSRRISRVLILYRAISYVAGISLVFSSLGILAVKFNLLFGSWLANPWVVATMILFYIILTLGMFDVLDLDVLFRAPFGVAPEVSGGISAFIYGCVTGLMASPCMTPALFTILGFVSQKSNIFSGGLILFFFALGMSFLVLLLSLSSSLTVFLPRPGIWMNEFRRILGFSMLFMIIKMLAVFTKDWQGHLLYAILLGIIAMYYFLSSKKDTVYQIIKAHQKAELQAPVDIHHIGVWDSLNILSLSKRTVAFVSLGLCIFYCGKTYLTYKKTKVLNVLVKLLK